MQTYQHIPLKKFTSTTLLKNDHLFLKGMRNESFCTDPIIFYPIKDVRVIEGEIERGEKVASEKKQSGFSKWFGQQKDGSSSSGGFEFELVLKRKKSTKKEEKAVEKTGWKKSDLEDIKKKVELSKSELVGEGKKKYGMYYKVSDTTTGTIVRSIFEQHGFRYMHTLGWNVLFCGKHLKLMPLKKLNEYQRVNHFPKSSEITRKNRLYVNFAKFNKEYPKEYTYCPFSFLFPEELGKFDLFLEDQKQMKLEEKITWIAKPITLSRGRGIYLLKDYSEIKDDVIEDSAQYVCSQYITDPFLINSLKFDLRIYVAVTSYCPLRVYVFENGLTRFASEKYVSPNKNYKDSFVHLTNYSINKKNKNFVFNESSLKDDVGSKWSLHAFRKYMKKKGKDVDAIFEGIYEVVIKTLITIEDQVVSNLRSYVPFRRNCFELFGFDILLDKKLKPWLLEVNLSPSLGARYPLDFGIKSKLLLDLFNMIEIKGYARDRKPPARDFFKCNRTPLNIMNAKKKLDWESEKAYKDIFHLKDLSVVEKLIVKETIDENNKRGGWVRVFPRKGCGKYEKFFKKARRENRLLRKALFDEEKVKVEKKGEEDIQVI